MQKDLPADSLVRETMASLGPGAKDFTLDDLAAWICQLEELCDSRDADLTPTSFRTDIKGSCLCTFPTCGTKRPTTGQVTRLQTKPVKGYAPLPEICMEKVSSRKKNARGEAKLHLSVERGPMLVLLTITDLDGATSTLRAVTAEGNDLIPIKHPATTVEATAVPFTPDQLLVRLRLVEAKMKRKREPSGQPSAAPHRNFETDAATRPASGMEYRTKRLHDDSVIESIVDREKGTVTIKSIGSIPHYGAATITFTGKDGETKIATDHPLMNAVLAPVLKCFLKNPDRCCELYRRKAAILKEKKSIEEKLPIAKPAEKKRLIKELEKKEAEDDKLLDLFFRTAAGGWMSVPEEERLALFEKAKRNDPKRAEALACRAHASFVEYNRLKEKHESTSNQAKKSRLSAKMGRKEIGFDEAMDAIAAIANECEQGGSKELNDAYTRLNEAMKLYQFA